MPAAVRSANLEAGANRQVTLYFGTLTIMVGLGDPLGLPSLPILFILKDRLHLGPQQIATFEAITFIPVYFGFLFGFLRDRWQPLGWGDRAYLALAAPAGAACYLWLAAVPIDYPRLLTAILLATAAFQFLNTATEALLTSVARRHLMTGRLSALNEFTEVVPGMIAFLLGGWMASNAPPQAIFLLAAVITAGIFGQALWRPGAVFPAAGRRKITSEDGIEAVRRLARHRPIWPAATILLLWNFSPGWGTPFFYYLTDEIGLSSEVFGVTRAVSFGCAAATTGVYAFLCQRHPLARVLWWGLIINIAPGLLFLLIKNGTQAIAIAAVVGSLTGFFNVALVDLLRRSCPEDLEGTAMMLGFSAFNVAGTAGDLVGAWLYERGGFALCLIIDAVANVSLLPVLAYLPRSVIWNRDGELTNDNA